MTTETATTATTGAASEERRSLERGKLSVTNDVALLLSDSAES